MFDISYHHKVADDILHISTTHRRDIQKAIEDKLATSPVFFGKPLQFSLKGLRSMRVGDYRVVFKLTKQEVFVVLIGHRSIVYKQAPKR